MYYLASNREWVTLPKLLENVAPTTSDQELLEALEYL